MTDPRPSRGRLAVTLSWDDGHPSDLRTAEICARHGFAATFYVPIRNREGLPVLDESGIRRLAAAGFEIGGHTYSHRYLDSIGLAEARVEIESGKKALEDITGEPISGFCYPGGKYDDRHVALVRELGFAYARTTVNLEIDGGTDPFRMPTTIQMFPHALGSNLAMLVKNGPSPRRIRRFCLSAPRFDLESRLEALFGDALANGSMFHLWGHSWELDRIDGFDRLDRFLARIRHACPGVESMTNFELSRR